MMYCILVLSFLLDGLLSNFLPFIKGGLSLFTPYFSVVSILLIIPFFRKEEEQKYYTIAFLYGFFYDIFYTNILMSHVILFVFLAYIGKKIWKNIQMNLVTIPLVIALFIGIYHVSSLFLFSIFNVIKPSFLALFYLWSHSILLNIIYGEILYLLFEKFSKKYHRMHS